MAAPRLPNNYYLNALGNSSESMAKYHYEATQYQKQNPFIAVRGVAKVTRDILKNIDKKIISVLKRITAGELEIDVACCQLLILIDYTNHEMHSIEPFIWNSYYQQYLAFLLYFIFGSRWSQQRTNIKINRINHPRHNLYQQSVTLRYLIDEYLPNLREKSVTLKYDIGSMDTISCLLVQYLHLSEGETSIASIICDFVDYKYAPFLYLVDRFVCSLTSRKIEGHYSAYTHQWYSFVASFDGERPNDHAFFNLLSCLLLTDTFMDHRDKRLKFEAHKMALNNVNCMPSWMGCVRCSGWYFKQNINRSIRCYYDPKVFVELLEAVFTNPCQLIQDAMLQDNNYALSLFFNGNAEAEVTVVTQPHFDDDIYYSMCANVHYIFKNIIDPHFSGNTSVMRNVLYQLMNCCVYFMKLDACAPNASGTSKGKFQLIQVLLRYIKRELQMDQFDSLVSARMKSFFGETQIKPKYIETMCQFKWTMCDPLSYDEGEYVSLYNVINAPPRKKRRIEKNAIDLLLHAAQLIENDNSNQ